jgi:hypothetical protein
MTPRRYRCCYCGYDLPAALPVTHEPNGAMLLNHRSALHPDRVGPYLARMPTDVDHNRVVVEATKWSRATRPPPDGSRPRDLRNLRTAAPGRPAAGAVYSPT